MITKPIWLVSPKPAGFRLSGSQPQSNTSFFFCESKAHCHLRRGKRDERWGMSPNQCQNTPLGCYLQTRVPGASRRDHMNQNRVTEDGGPGFGASWAVSHLVEASHSLLTNSGDVGHTKRGPQSPAPLQRVRTNNGVVRTQLVRYGDKSRHEEKGGENKDRQ